MNKQHAFYLLGWLMVSCTRAFVLRNEPRANLMIRAEPMDRRSADMKRMLDRRRFTQMIQMGFLILEAKPAVAAVSLSDAKKAVEDALIALDPLPSLLQNENWDSVRTVLKIQCGKLWALGEAQNPIVQFAKVIINRDTC